jgi:hypothetical protein
MTEPPIDPNVDRLAALTGYLAYVLSLCPDPEAEENSLILVLVAFQKTLERRISKRTPTVEWNNAMRWAVSETNRLLDTIYRVEFDAVDNWNPLTELPSNPQQNLAAVLMTLCHELLGDVAEAEIYLRDELKMAAEDYAKEIFAAYDRAVLAGEIEAEDGQAKIA